MTCTIGLIDERNSYCTVFRVWCANGASRLAVVTFLPLRLWESNTSQFRRWGRPDRNKGVADIQALDLSGRKRSVVNAQVVHLSNKVPDISIIPWSPLRNAVVGHGTDAQPRLGCTAINPNPRQADGIGHIGLAIVVGNHIVVWAVNSNAIQVEVNSAARITDEVIWPP